MTKVYVMSIYLCANLLLSALATADSSDMALIQGSCLSNSGSNNDYLQEDMESWFTAARRESKEYKERIQQIESDGGVFSYALIPELIGLGLIAQEQSNHVESSEAFQRALHVLRVNDGLYTTRQLPLMDLLIENNSALQKWKQVANSYDRMYWLYRRNYADNDPRQLLNLKKMRRWYIESYNKDTGRSLKELFSSAEALYKQGLKIMMTCTDDRRESLCFWHKSCCPDAGTAQGICPLDRG